MILLYYSCLCFHSHSLIRYIDIAILLLPLLLEEAKSNGFDQWILNLALLVPVSPIAPFPVRLFSILFLLAVPFFHAYLPFPLPFHFGPSPR